MYQGVEFASLRAIMERFHQETIKSDPRFAEAAALVREIRSHSGNMMSRGELTDPVRDLADRAGELIQAMCDDHGVEFGHLLSLVSQK